MPSGSRPPSHYDTLGVVPTASAEEIRRAYRALARQLHPDARGGQPSPEMVIINQAWQVLSDPHRRAAYDAGRLGVDERSPVSSPADMLRTPRPETLQPARFPWRAVVIMALVGTVGVLALSLISQPPASLPVDNVLTPGSCVVVEPGEMAREVRCGDPHDAVVRVLVPFDQRCPSDSTAWRDRQGRGWACVDRVEGA